MWYRFLLFIGILFCHLVALGKDFSPEKPYQLMIYGDSLSSAYQLPKKDAFASKLQEALIKEGYRQVTVISFSKSGETSVGGLRRQKQALSKKPNGVILELGINDVLKGKSIAEITQNLSQLIQGFQSHNIAVLLAGMKAPPITEPAYAQQFEKMYQQLARKYKVPLYPFFMQGLFQAAGNQYEQAHAYLLADKVHPNKTGIQYMVDHILPSVKLFLKKQGVNPISQ